MSKDLFNDKTRTPSPKMTTRQELDRLIADRANDAKRPQPVPKPSWASDQPDPQDKHIRMRERRIRFLQNRLEGAKLNMERNWDQNR